jgi:PIN domain nuclease of toxin-antitoxin system
MKLLIDTHTFLWFINQSEQLSVNAKNLLESDIDIWLSVASLWEIAIKVSIGKLVLPDTYENFIPRQIGENEIEVLPISIVHLNIVSSLPLHHKDPFDRLIIAQALTEQISVISADDKFDKYSVSRIW